MNRDHPTIHPPAPSPHQNMSPLAKGGSIKDRPAPPKVAVRKVKFGEINSELILTLQFQAAAMEAD